jgi:hypothetical protein
MKDIRWLLDIDQAIYWKLHASGLKPTEGKLSHHSVKAENFEFRKSLSWNVAKEWESTKNEALVKEILNLYLL